MRKKKSKIELENIELKPQVIGYSFKKKNNLGRVIFIFICFILVVYYINDITIFINGLIGKQTSETIVENATGNKNKPNNQGESKEIVYNVFNNDLSLSESGLVINNFNYINNNLTFDANNNSSDVIDLTNRKYFMELYTEDKTLIQRMKIDFDSINANSKVSFSLDVSTPFYYLVLIEKSIDDYPVASYPEDENGIVTIVCTKNIDELIYKFKEDKLISVKHTVTDSNINDKDYSLKYLAYQNRASNYNALSGVDATFNGTLNGFSFIASLDLTEVDISKLNEKYYFDSSSTVRIVNFEIQTYGFTCK